MTISATDKYQRPPVAKDVVYLDGFSPLGGTGNLADHIKTFTVQKGEDRNNGDWYVDWVLEVDLDGILQPRTM